MSRGTGITVKYICEQAKYYQEAGAERNKYEFDFNDIKSFDADKYLKNYDSNTKRRKIQQKCKENGIDDHWYYYPHSFPCITCKAIQMCLDGKIKMDDYKQQQKHKQKLSRKSLSSSNSSLSMSTSIKTINKIDMTWKEKRKLFMDKKRKRIESKFEENKKKRHKHYREPTFLYDQKFVGYSANKKYLHDTQSVSSFYS